MTALFKYVYPDGTVKYSDLDRSYCIDINNGSTYGIGLVRDIVDELYPITLPYFPADNAIKVYREGFLVDEKNGDFYMFVASCLLCVAGFVTFTLYEDHKYKKQCKEWRKKRR